MTGPETAAKLSGTWKVTWVRDADIPSEAVPTLVFEEARLAGFAGCNRFGAALNYGADGNLNLRPPEVTRKACGPKAMALEAQVLRALHLINAVVFDGDDSIRLSAFGREMLTADRQLKP